MGILDQIYNYIFKNGINILYGRPGTGKSRIAHSILNIYGEESVLISPNDNIDKRHISYGEAILTTSDDCSVITRTLAILQPKVAIIDTISAIHKLDVVRYSQRFKNIGEQYNIKIIFIAQVRQNPKTGSIYPHNVPKALLESSAEIVEIKPVGKTIDITEVILECKKSGRKIAFPIPRNKNLCDNDIYKYIPADNKNEAEIMVKNILTNVNKSGRQVKILRW